MLYDLSIVTTLHFKNVYSKSVNYILHFLFFTQPLKGFGNFRKFSYNLKTKHIFCTGKGNVTAVFFLNILFFVIQSKFFL